MDVVALRPSGDGLREATRAAGVEFELSLAGPAGEPVDPRWTLAASWMNVPPLRADPTTWWAEVPVAVPGGRPRLVRVEPAGRQRARVSAAGGDGGADEGDGSAVGGGGGADEQDGSAVAAEAVYAAVRRVLALDVDLSGLYERAAEDPDLSWVTGGAGRIGRSPRVFDDVVKTLCTVNCSWTATHRMAGALVAHLGEVTTDGRARAFPTPAAMAAVGTGFYRDVVRAGYRAPWLAELARRQADGEEDLETLISADLSDEEVAARLRALPGVGGYAAAHVMQLLGRFSRPVLDSWTRPTYARLTAQTAVRDDDVRARFAGYGPWAGLAFWLFCHHDPTFH